MKRKIKVWNVKQLARNISLRQHNKLDVNIAVSGVTGSGKSTFVAKLLFRIDGFDPWKHQVYQRDDVIRLLTTQKFGICWDDEAINSSYKRDFQSVDQRGLIKTVAMYRSYCNLYISVLPEFFSLDKDLRDYYALHIFVIKRGLAVMLRRDSKSIYANDRWHTNYNEKLEKDWDKKRARNPNFKYPYHRLKGFICYIRYNDITEKQRELIEEVKEKRRAEVTNSQTKKETPWVEKIYTQLVGGKLTKEGLRQICLVEDKKYSSVTVNLNRILNDKGDKKTLKDYFYIAENEMETQSKKDIESLVPNI